MVRRGGDDRAGRRSHFGGRGGGSDRGRRRRLVLGSGRGHGVTSVSALAQQQVQRVSDPPDARDVTALGRLHCVGHRGHCRRGGRRGRLLLFFV